MQRFQISLRKAKSIDALAQSRYCLCERDQVVATYNPRLNYSIHNYSSTGNHAHGGFAIIIKKGIYSVEKDNMMA